MRVSQSHTGGPRLGSGVVKGRATGLRNTSSAPQEPGQAKVIDGFGSPPPGGIQWWRLVRRLDGGTNWLGQWQWPDGVGEVTKRVGRALLGSGLGSSL